MSNVNNALSPEIMCTIFTTVFSEAMNKNDEEAFVAELTLKMIQWNLPIVGIIWTKKKCPL